MSVCTDIRLIRKGDNGDLLQVTIDNNTTALWFYELENAMDYVGKEVIVEYRNDILDGQLHQFIKTFVRPETIITLDKKDNFKLFLDQEDNNSTISFNDAQLGDTLYGAIVFCSKQEFRSSSKSVWLELTVRDKNMKVTTLRLFNYDNTSVNYEGKYILCDMERNAYGFQTRQVIEAGGSVEVNKEVEIAKQYIENYFIGNEVACKFITETCLLELMKDIVDYEKGYAIVRLATELALCDSLHNISKDVSIDAVAEAILCSYAYMTRESVLSKDINNIIVSNRYMFKHRRIVLMCLDTHNANKPKEATVFEKIKEMAGCILQIRKGVK